MALRLRMLDSFDDVRVGVLANGMRRMSSMPRNWLESPSFCTMLALMRVVLMTVRGMEMTNSDFTPSLPFSSVIRLGLTSSMSFDGQEANPRVPMAAIAAIHAMFLAFFTIFLNLYCCSLFLSLVRTLR